MKAIDAVIVHYGNQDPTIRVALDALEWASSITVVANDQSVIPDRLKGKVEWIIPDRNLGFGAAFNFGAERGSSDLVVVLNNDIELQAVAIYRCVEQFADERVVIVGPLLKYPDGTVQSSAGTYSRVIGWPEAVTSAPISVVDCHWVTGAVMIVRRSYWSANRMDGTYFLGCEDTDYCRRAREQGMRVILVPTEGAVHYGSRVISGPRWNYYYARNHVWFAREFYGPLRRLLLVVWLIGRSLRVTAADLLRRRGLGRSIAMWNGVVDSRLAKPPFGSLPLNDEPIPQRWMKW